MDIFELVIFLIIILGLSYLLYIISRDPIFLLKSFLRWIKSPGNWQIRIIFIPIWGPIFIIDKIFGLKIYIHEFEDASIPLKISFKEYNKYLLIRAKDIFNIENVLQSFQKEYNQEYFNYNLNGSRIKIAQFENNIVIKFEQDISFSSINFLILYIDNSAPQNTTYDVKGIFINPKDRDKSYFVFHDTGFSLKLIGKTYRNQKMYVDLNSAVEAVSNETIFLNSNMDYFKNMDFDKFENEISRLRYNEIVVTPTTSQF